MSLRFCKPGKSLLISHLVIDDHIYFLVLISLVVTRPQTGHQLHNSFEAIKSLFGSQALFLSVEAKLTNIGASLEIGQDRR